MTDIKQTVTETEDSGNNEVGAAVRQKTKQIHTESAADSKTTAQNIVWYILGVLEVVLAIRFVLKLLGANSANAFVDLTYSISGIITAPFDSIFGVTSTTTGDTNSVFEPSIIVAGLVYMLIAWGVVKLITINQKQ